MAKFKAEIPTDLINSFKNLETNTDKMLEDIISQFLSWINKTT